MPLRRLSTALLSVALAALALAASASACSCAPRPPAESLREADAALVGRLVRVIPRGRYRADYRYEVMRVYRGGGLRRGGMLTVRSGRRAAACALPRRPGRYGLFLTWARGHWLGGICGVIAPRRLWHAARHGKGAEASAGAGASVGEEPAPCRADRQATQAPRG